MFDMGVDDGGPDRPWGMAKVALCLAILAARINVAPMKTPAPALPVLLRMAQMDFAPDWQLPAHAHANFNEMIVVAEGGVEVEIRGEILRAGPGNVMIYPRGVPHREKALGEGVRMLYLVWNEGASAGRRRGGRWPGMAFDRTGRIQAAVRWMLELHPAKDRNAQLTLSSLLQTALCEYAQAAPTIGDERLLRVRRHVQERMAHEIRLEDLAKIACLSKFHFAREFQRATGQSPMHYVRQVRVEAARTLLLTSPMPLRAIAPLVGFSDEFQLSRVFRQVTGYAPTAVRKQNAPLIG
jgi:AraC-like DNA-binding protein